VPLTGVHALVGPNGSGKSAFMDVLAFVRDVLRVGVRDAVFGNAGAGIPKRAVSPLELSWCQQGGPIEIAVVARAPDRLVSEDSPLRILRYELAVDVHPELRCTREQLWLCPREQERPPLRQIESFPQDTEESCRKVRTQTPRGWRRVVSRTESGEDFFRAETRSWKERVRYDSERSVLTNLPADEQRFPRAHWFKRLLMEGTFVLALSPERMKLPSPFGSSSVLMADGSNLPHVVHWLETRDPDRLADWIGRVRALLCDVLAIRSRETPEDRSRYIEVEYANGLKLPSRLLSDGTLRLLALMILSYVPSAPRTILLEDPENGIHPQAIPHVIDSLHAVQDAQVILATHSTHVLRFLGRHQLLCFGKTPKGNVDVVAGEEHPSLKEWRAEDHLGEALAAGVLG